MKKFLFAIVILLGLLVAAGFLNSINFGLPLSMKATRVAKTAIRAKDPKKCQILPIKEERPAPPEDGKGLPRITYGLDACLRTYVEATKDAQACELMNDAHNKNSCYFQIAQNTNDILWCDKFDLTAKGDSHWDGIQEKNRCISYIAEVHSDAEICKALDKTDPAYWHVSVLCRAVATLNIQECNAFDVPQFKPPAFAYTPQYECINAIVMRTHDPKDCEQITGEGYPANKTDWMSDKNTCLRNAGCDKPQLRQELCAQYQYSDKWILPEEKEGCVTEKWECAEVYKRITQPR